MPEHVLLGAKVIVACELYNRNDLCPLLEGDVVTILETLEGPNELASAVSSPAMSVSMCKAGVHNLFLQIPCDIGEIKPDSKRNAEGALHGKA